MVVQGHTCATSWTPSTKLANLGRPRSRGPDPADAKAAAPCRNLLAVEPALWTFAGRARGDVEPTNNNAERVLRPAVLWRKNSFGCQSDGGCRFAERMLTAVQTLHPRGKNVLDYLARAVAALCAGQPAPSLLA